MSLLNVPNDVLRNILFIPAKLDAAMLTVLRFVCRRFRDIIPIQKDYRLDKWAYEEKIQTTIYTMCAAYGYINIMDWLFVYQTLRPTSAAYEYATYNGDIAIVDWLERHDISYDERTWYGATRTNNLELLKILKERTATAFPDTLLGRLAVAIFPNELLIIAAGWGSFEVLKWLRTIGLSINDNEIYYLAASSGRLDILTWTITEGSFNFNDSFVCGTIYAHAAAYNHKHIIQWLRAQGVPWHPFVYSGAAEGGYIELMEWLRVNGALWDEDACLHAVTGDQLESLKWLRSNGAPWHYLRCLDKATGEVKEWLLQNRSDDN